VIVCVAQALIWIGLVAVWAAACLFVLRTRRSTDGVAPIQPTEPT
jgi:hypothetical protein